MSKVSFLLDHTFVLGLASLQQMQIVNKCLKCDSDGDCYKFSPETEICSCQRVSGVV
jgi:hypothetical protein